MIRYKMIISWSDADAAFIARIPELPGCMADGKTYEEAATNAQRAMASWIKTAKSLGRPIPSVDARREAVARLHKGFLLRAKPLSRERAHARRS